MRLDAGMALVRCYGGDWAQDWHGGMLLSLLGAGLAWVADF